jgi:hypothetical protein
MTAYKVYDVAEPLVAYRWWKATPLLTSLSFQVYWRKEMKAKPCHEILDRYNWPGYHQSNFKCNGPVCYGAEKGGVAHGCGLYALNTLSAALFCPDIEKPCVLGKVLLAGRVHPYDRGYRAEKAQIAGLYTAEAFLPFERFFDGAYPRLTSGVEVVAEHYKVPLLGTLTPAEHEDVRDSAERAYVSRHVSFQRYFL